MLVSHILKRKGAAVVSLGPTATVGEAARILASNRIGSVLILGEGATDGAGIRGILSERDIVRALSVSGAACLDQPVGDLMSTDVATCRPDATLQEMMELMTERRIRHVPVVAGDPPVLAGLISIGDVVKHRLDEIQAEAEALAQYVKNG